MRRTTAMWLPDQVHGQGNFTRRAHRRQLHTVPEEFIHCPCQPHLWVIIYFILCYIGLVVVFEFLSWLFLLLCSCGYDQQVGKNGAVQAATDGLLALGKGSVSLLSQLKQQGVTKNVLGHCFSTSGGGFLFFGDDIVPTSRVTWVPMARTTSG